MTHESGHLRALLSPSRQGRLQKNFSFSNLCRLLLLLSALSVVCIPAYCNGSKKASGCFELVHFVVRITGTNSITLTCADTAALEL